MIHKASDCPYCGQGVALDDYMQALAFDADKGVGTPCKHCAFVSVGLDVRRKRRLDRKRSCVVLFEHGEGQRLVPLFPSPFDPLVDYVDMLACGLLPAQRLPRGVEYRIVGGTATTRDENQPGTGRFCMVGSQGEELVAILDAFGIYSLHLARLATRVRRLLANART